MPGANDNLSGVAVVLELARALRERPVQRRARAARLDRLRGVVHGGDARLRRAATSRRSPPERTEVVCLDSVGSPELILIEGEGMLRMRDYTPELRDRIAAVAARAGVHLRRRLRLGLATDGLIALKAGYPSAAIGSVTKYKLPLNYHSQRDTADALVYETVRDAAVLCEALVRESAAP